MSQFSDEPSLDSMDVYFMHEKIKIQHLIYNTNTVLNSFGCSCSVHAADSYKTSHL